MVLDNLFWLQLVLEIVGLVVRFVLSVGVSLDSDGGSLRLTSSSLSFCNGGGGGSHDVRR